MILTFYIWNVGSINEMSVWPLSGRIAEYFMLIFNEWKWNGEGVNAIVVMQTQIITMRKLKQSQVHCEVEQIFDYFHIQGVSYANPFQKDTVSYY